MSNLSLDVAGFTEPAVVEKYPDDLPERNKQLLELIRTRLPDDKGDKWWDEFEEDLRQNRFSLREIEL